MIWYNINNIYANKNLLDGATWFGCGKHVPTAMSNSPKDEWCTCQSSTGAELNGFPPKLGDAVAAKSSEDWKIKRNWLRRSPPPRPPKKKKVLGLITKYDEISFN